MSETGAEGEPSVRSRKLSPDARKAFADLDAKLAPDGEYVAKVQERERARRVREAAIMELLKPAGSAKVQHRTS